MTEQNKQPVRLEPNVSICGSCEVGDHEDCDMHGTIDGIWACACCGVSVE